MKKIMLALAIIAGLSSVSQAQGTKQGTAQQTHNKAKLNPAARAKKSAAHAEKELGLNADQKVKWEAATLERINANAPLQDKMKGSTTPEERKALHAQAEINIDKFDSTVNSFLTPDQKTKWKVQKAKMKEARKDHRKGDKGDSHQIDEQE